MTIQAYQTIIIPYLNNDLSLEPKEKRTRDKIYSTIKETNQYFGISGSERAYKYDDCIN
jgi:hypothetical protein